MAINGNVNGTVHGILIHNGLKCVNFYVVKHKVQPAMLFAIVILKLRQLFSLPEPTHTNQFRKRNFRYYSAIAEIAKVSCSRKCS